MSSNLTGGETATYQYDLFKRAISAGGRAGYARFRRGSHCTATVTAGLVVFPTLTVRGTSVAAAMPLGTVTLT